MSSADATDSFDDRQRFLDWLELQVQNGGRGSEDKTLDVDPGGLFWAGRLAPESEVLDMGLGDRGERIDPCAIGMIVKSKRSTGVSFSCDVTFKVWTKFGASWRKSEAARIRLSIEIPNNFEDEYVFGASEIAEELRRISGEEFFRAEVRINVTQRESNYLVLEIRFVNTSLSVKERAEDDSREKSQHAILYECDIAVSDAEFDDFILEDLPDSYRYDRVVKAWGVNGGVVQQDGRLSTTDSPCGVQMRRIYWSADEPEPDLSFETLAQEPIRPLTQLAEAARSWAMRAWSDDELDRRQRSENWSSETRRAAGEDAEACFAEISRMFEGISLLESDKILNTSFRLMNRAMIHSSAGRYQGWRPFQVGFLLTTLSTIATPDEDQDVANVIWFATGGGKTETYLGLIVTAAFHERLSGKQSGITAWSRFPLRMLSLQQTQRFADALAGAELVRLNEEINGDPFSMGFFMGDNSTPNQVHVDPEPGKFDASDDELVSKAKVLLRCPFCHGESIIMAFNRLLWRLEHRCVSEDCPWPEEALPFYIVDYEIYRYLPTVVVGTLDKAASISLQASMRGFVGPPWGVCSIQGHGFVYAPRSGRGHGCLVPGCPGKQLPLSQESQWFGPTFRLQDELHLLRDSLGAVDSHYESIFDDLQERLTGRKSRILGSSATLAGFTKQVEVLYRRRGRVFPIPGPTTSSSFWTSEGAAVSRRYLAIAPRGVTAEFAVDRIITILQQSVRLLITDRERVCREAGISGESAEMLLSLYGVDVVYGNTLRDLEATSRSLETQIPVSPLNSASLTGRTEFDEVRKVLDRLDNPEIDFGQRIHVITASSMMSHGVDIDRLNIMVMIGVPLSAAEFIQATARVGRNNPGLVFVIHKIARERDAGVFRYFPKFVQHADRLVEPIPVTRNSRRVLKRTAAGAEMARVLAIHEPRSDRALTTVSRLRQYFEDAGIDASGEASAVAHALGFESSVDELMLETLDEWFSVFFQNLRDPSAGSLRTNKVLPWMPDGPMISLRDVEEQATVRD